MGSSIEAILDTGFTGFLQVNLLQAFPVGLALAATAPMTYANGATHHKLMAWGTVSVGSREATGLVVLEEGPCDVLLGMGFLKALKGRLVMTKDQFSIMEEDWIEQLAAQAEAAKAKPEVAEQKVIAEPSGGVAPEGEKK